MIGFFQIKMDFTEGNSGILIEISVPSSKLYTAKINVAICRKSNLLMHTVRKIVSF